MNYVGHVKWTCEVDMCIRSGSRSLTDIISFFFWINENILSKFYENYIKGSHRIL